MRFLVLGAGAIGGYFGAKLAHGGSDVTFLVRPHRAAQLADHGLVLKSHEGETRTVAKTVQAGGITAPFDVVLLCCKAYDLPDAIAAIAPAIGPSSAILPFLNGIRHLDMLAERFGPSHVLGGLTAVNAALGPCGEVVQSPVKVDMTAFGETDGNSSDRCARIAQAFAAAGVKASLSATVLDAMWTKFAAFSAVAAVATLCRSRAGAIAAAAISGRLVDTALDETRRVAAAHGLAFPDGVADMVRGLFSQPASAYGPSILVDMEQGQPTEGEHTIGDMVAKADQHGVAVPVLAAALCNLQVYENARVVQRSTAAA